jgi:hypothetical protein
MFSLRRNRAFLVKILLLTPLTWLCVVLYMNSSTKIIQQQQQGHQEQIVYVNENKAEDNLIPQEQVEIKGPPLKDNLLRKKKPTPSGLFSDAAHPLWVGVTSLFCDVGILFFVFRFFFFLSRAISQVETEEEPASLATKWPAKASWWPRTSPTAPVKWGRPSSCPRT